MHNVFVVKEINPGRFNLFVHWLSFISTFTFLMSMFCCYCTCVEWSDSICISGSVTRLHELSGASWLWLVMSWRGSGLGHNGHRCLSTFWDQRGHWPGLFISEEKKAAYFHNRSMIFYWTVVLLLLTFTPRDIHQQLGNIHGLSATVKAWIANSIHGKGTIRADTWVAMVILIILSNLSAVKNENSALLKSMWERSSLIHI